LIRYWLTPEGKKDARFNEKVQEINKLYQQAPGLTQIGENVISTDEMTGVQALERKHPGLPIAPGKVERREFEYIRHGTLSLITNFTVATGKFTKVSSGDTRNEADFLVHIQRTIESEHSFQNGILLLIISIFISPNPLFGSFPLSPICQST
jgi:hypothetical protein